MSVNESPVPLFGLLLAGGKSRRMGRDKALLRYHGKPQLIWGFELLDRVCQKTYVSIADFQAGETVRAELPRLVDNYSDLGPAGGLMTAHETHPDMAWLSMACDLPFVESDTLEQLIASRNPDRDATAFASSHDGLPEPLCAIWEPQGLEKLARQVRDDLLCPRKCLINSDTELVVQTNPEWLDNMNSQTDLTCKQFNL